MDNYFHFEFVMNSPKIIIGGTATNELDLYENKTAVEFE